MDTARPIDGCPGFFVTRDGRVFGPRGEKAQSTMKGYGYKYVSFWKDGRSYKRTVHSLVAEAFIGKVPKGMHVMHGPGGKLDNRVENLSIGTPKQNAADKRRDGTHQSGHLVPVAKLTPYEVMHIRTHKGAYRGVQRDLALAYGVVESVICNIMRGNTYPSL
ncbi:HNH endonuclease [Mycobacterium phage Beatrix]|nr:HNH endonuclease [Mycobacterium phage Beatrix]